MSHVIEVVGSLNIDLVSVTSRVPNPGETIASKSFSTGFGGKGANQAVACARCLRDGPLESLKGGIKVYMAGAVGDDQFGKDFIGHLENEQISADHVKVQRNYTTGTAVILVEESTGENRILISAGANGQFQPDDVRLSEKADAAARHIAIYQLETPLDTVIASIKAAKAAGKDVLLNPAPAVTLPDELYLNIDHLILNESEASLLSGISEESLMDSLHEVAKDFCYKGVRVVIITLGAAGVYLQNAEAAKAGQEGKMIPSRKVQVVDTTAAGDTFVGAYAAYLVMHGFESITQAVEFANVAASKTVEKSGAQASIPFLGDIAWHDS